MLVSKLFFAVSFVDKQFSTSKAEIFFAPCEYNSQIAENKNATSAQVVLAWELAQKPYIVPIPGTTKMHRLEENFKGADVKLSAQELADLNTALSKLDINEIFF